MIVKDGISRFRVSARVILATMAAAIALGISGTPIGWTPQAHATEPTAVPRDVVILLDITGSMRGAGADPKARDIWDLVAQKVIQQISDLPEGTSLAIVPYDAGPRLAKIWPRPLKRTADPIEFATIDDTTRAAAIRRVRSLVPDGQSTHICDTLEYGLIQLKAWRDQQASDQRSQEVFLYTDGLDNGRCGTRFVPELIKTFKGAAQDFPFLFGVYIDLNGHLTASEISAIRGQPGFVVGTGLPDFVHLDPGPIELGAQAAMTSGVDVPLHFIGSLPARELTAAVEVLPASLGLTASPSTITIAQEVTVHISSDQSLAPGSYAGAIRLTPASGAFLFTNSSADFFFEVPAAATPSPTPAPTPLPTVVAAPVPTATPQPAPPEPPPPSDPTALLVLAAFAALAGILALLYWRTPRFAKDAALEIAGEALPLREIAGFTFIRPQQVIVSGSGSPFFLEETGAGAESTRLVALRGTRDALFDPAGTPVTANGMPMTEPGPIGYGTALAGPQWSAKFVRIEPDPDYLRFGPDAD